MEIQLAFRGHDRDSSRRQIPFQHGRRIGRYVQERIFRPLLPLLPFALVPVGAGVYLLGLSGLHKRHQALHQRGGDVLHPVLLALVYVLRDAYGAFLAVEHFRLQLPQFILAESGAKRHFIQKPPMCGAIIQKTAQFAGDHGAAYGFRGRVEFAQLRQRVFGEVLPLLAPLDQRGKRLRFVRDGFARVARFKHLVAFIFDFRQNPIQVAQFFKRQACTPKCEVALFFKRVFLVPGRVVFAASGIAPPEILLANIVEGAFGVLIGDSGLGADAVDDLAFALFEHVGLFLRLGLVGAESERLALPLVIYDEGAPVGAIQLFASGIDGVFLFARFRVQAPNGIAEYPGHPLPLP